MAIRAVTEVALMYTKWKGIFAVGILTLSFSLCYCQAKAICVKVKAFGIVLPGLMWFPINQQRSNVWCSYECGSTVCAQLTNQAK
jgi:hypothetical protein